MAMVDNFRQCDKSTGSSCIEDPHDRLVEAAFGGAGAVSESLKLHKQHEQSGKDALSSDDVLLEDTERAHFNYFRQNSDPDTGLTKDRSTPDSAASIAATGFSLTAYPIAAERGWISRDEAVDYTLKVMRTLSNVPQGESAAGQSGNHGLFYHFLDMKEGTRTWNSELSTIDTALLMSGVLFARDYFKADSSKEAEIRRLSDDLYRRVDWNWMLDKENGRIRMGWYPDNAAGHKQGFDNNHWYGYNEAMILELLALGSPSHPVPAETWKTYTESETVNTDSRQPFINFGPLFGHQYSHVWTDFRGIMDAQNRSLGWDYFENSRRATLEQNRYGIENPLGLKDYNATSWGWTACDGPGDSYNRMLPSGQKLNFESYVARAPRDHDDGTIAPTAAVSSLPFAPEVVMPTIRHWRNQHPELWSDTGFADAFNPNAEPSKPSGWVDQDRLGIDQGPIVAMLENQRSGLIWKTMRNDPYLVAGLRRAGFTGGWLSGY